MPILPLHVRRMAASSGLRLRRSASARLLAVSLAGLATSAWADETGDKEFFVQKIQPILNDHCTKCHSHEANKMKGGLVVDSISGLTTGGDSGPAVVPGDPEKSLLIEAIRYHNDDLQMPPKGKKLADADIALLTEWVKRGAVWPETAGKTATRGASKITDEDRKWWSFQPLARPTVPRIEGDTWSRNDLDPFILTRLQKEELQPAPPASRAALLRRLYFNLIGLPPSPEAVQAFDADTSETAVEKVVDQLLADPRYGEHWAVYWLDLVRYAESDGYRIDDYRPQAWRYRDYVIRAFNEDKPYNRFVAEQLAGDEIAGNDPDARTATGYLRHWIYEYNNRDVITQWTNILNDITDTTSDVFLGLGLQCARCHDHKFDPILQKDYYRLQAFFAPLLPRDDLKLATPEQEATYREQLASWEAKTAELRAQIEVIEAPHREKAAEGAITKFPPETQELIRKPVAERTPYEHQLAELAYRQVTYEYDRLVNRMKGPDKDKLVALYKQLGTFDKEKPAPLPEVLAVSDVGPKAPPVTIPRKAALGEIEPGFLTLLDEKPAEIPDPEGNSTGRRKALAEWLTQPENPLTSRVMVNRMWQYHFGRGLVSTSSDFGKLGETPSHPELLDWLARRFVEEGWSLKKLHRQILLSATYQQAAQNPMAEIARVKDPENRLLWRANTRRLEAEQIRDAILATTGELETASGGAGVDFTQPRRTVYTKVIRNTRDPLLEVFDGADRFASASQRNTTTTPTQSLLMINSPWSQQRATAFAQLLKKDASSSDPQAMVTDAFWKAYAREPSQAERDGAQAFLERQASLVSLKQEEPKAAPFVGEKMPFRDGRAALLTPKSTQERLSIPANTLFPTEDFTVEAFVMLKSVSEGADVRTIVSQWSGKKGHPGWSLGVTGKGSRYKPQTLVLQLSGDQAWTPQDPVEPLFSGLHLELGKPYYVGVTVDLDETSEKGVTFYAKDLSNDDEPIQTVQLKHSVTSGIRSEAPLVIGGRDEAGKHLFDGLIDDVRISRVPLPQSQLLVDREGTSEHTVGYWRFEAEPGVYRDSTSRGGDIAAAMIQAPKMDPTTSAWVDFCQVILNSNEFLYVD